MSAWTSDELDTISNAAELQITSLRRVQAAGIGKNAAFADETGPAVNDRIDAAYRGKYRSYGGAYTEPMVSPAARATTLRLVPA